MNCEPVKFKDMEIGITTFVENTPDPATGQLRSPHERMMNLLEEIELSDQLGLDVFAIGEHHRPDFIVSSPAVVLAAAAVRPKPSAFPAPLPCSVPTTRCGYSRTLPT
jgi:hypothetical protein